jgi:hypothetical protein
LKRKVKVEFQDEEGTKYTLALEGKPSKETIFKFVEFLQLMDAPIEEDYTREPDSKTLFGKLYALIEESFPAGDFSSSDLAKEYEEHFSEPLRLSTVATYLGRMTDKGYLKRQKFGNSWVYRRIHLPTKQVLLS